MPTTAPYVDLYLLPVPEGNLETYREQATIFGTVAREYGALSYREVIADDPADNFTVEAGLKLTAALVEFHSRAHRDEVMADVLNDPRIESMLDAEQIADMSRMSYGGFAPLVTV